MLSSIWKKEITNFCRSTVHLLLWPQPQPHKAGNPHTNALSILDTLG